MDPAYYAVGMSTAKTVYVGCGDWSGDTGKIQVFALDAQRGRLELSQELPAGGVAAFMARTLSGRPAGGKRKAFTAGSESCR